jgi:catechol 2,3-dioxygenase-like lactoylglutathione lyase family enzyme
MKIVAASIFVEDQAKALAFYTEKLGLVKKQDVPLGEYRWLTVVSPDDEHGTELLLEPNINSAAKTYQKALFEQRIPATSFWVEDVEKEYERLTSLGVTFTVEPTHLGPVTLAKLDDTCGNLIQIQKMG